MHVACSSMHGRMKNCAVRFGDAADVVDIGHSFPVKRWRKTRIKLI